MQSGWTLTITLILCVCWMVYVFQEVCDFKWWLLSMCLSGKSGSLQLKYGSSCLTVHYVCLMNIMHFNSDRNGCCGSMISLQFNCRWNWGIKSGMISMSVLTEGGWFLILNKVELSDWLFIWELFWIIKWINEKNINPLQVVWNALCLVWWHCVKYLISNSEQANVQNCLNCGQ